MPSQLKKFNLNLSRKINFLYLALGLFPAVAFLTLTLSPTLSPDNTSALTGNATMSVGVDESLSLRIVEYNEETGEWDIDTSEIGTNVVHGDFASAVVKVIASTNGLGGYTLSLSDVDNNNALTSPRNITSTIPSLSSSITLDNITDTTEKFPIEKWGYSWAKNSDTSSLTFNSVPLNNATAIEKQKDATNESGSNSYTFTLGVRVSTDTIADTYSDQIMFSLVGNPSPTSPLFFRTQYMQQFTPQICNTVKAPLPSTTEVTTDNGGNYFDDGTYASKVPSTTIIDQRDNQTYTIRKLADGNCWMTENLRYGAEPDTSVTPSDTPTPRAYASGDTAKTATTSAGASKLQSTLTTSRIYTASGCGSIFGNGDTANYSTPSICIYDANTPSTVDTSYNTVRFGALYNFCAASGGTVCSTEPNMNNISGAVDSTHADAPRVAGSICPTNWSLPQMTASPSGSGDITTGYNADNAYSYSYNKLLNNYAIAGTSGEYTKLLPLPLEFVRAGYAAGSGSLYRRGASGYYWSSTPYTSTDVDAYYLDFNSSSVNRYGSNRAYGFSVRCVLAP